MDVGTEVWAKVPGAAVWAAGEVLDCQYAAGSSSGIVQVRRLDTGDVITRRYSARESSAAELCLRNQTRDFVNMSSLTGLEHLHEPALLQALSERFAADHIYTSIGDILVAMNPLKALPLYSQQHIDRYKRAMYGSSAKDSRQMRRTRSQEAMMAASDALDGGEETPPHVFAIGGKAFSGLLKRERRNQSILVSGESGSGKTESTKFLMQFLTSVGRDHSVSEHDAGDVVEIGKRILQTNPILESFGNAQTIRNDNSSRFGKFIKIQFGEHNQIVGAKIVSYLLEKVRLIHQSPEERSFHIFYELLEGSDAAFLESLGLQRGAKYELLNSYGPHFSRRGGLGAKYAQLYTQTVRAFQDTGVDEQERLEIFKILAALLHLGNVSFAASGSDEDGTTVTPASRPHLDKCAELMGVDVVQLEALLVSREIKAGVEVMVLKLSPEQAKDISRSLAKAIYGRLFTWLVRRLSDEINYFDSSDSESVRDELDGDVATIGILDIFGFESLNRNGFEQLCINYANERLQAQFNEFVFVREQQVYMAEGIDWRTISYPSNEACLALFDDKSSGLFSLLDQECLMPKGSNQALSTKFYRYHGDSDGATDVGRLKQPQGALPLLMTSFSRYLHRTESEEEAARKDPKKHPFSASKMERVKHQFVVHHFAGRVCYNVEQFVEKNTDSLPADASSILSSSSNDVVVAVGGDANTDTPAADSAVAGRRRYSMLRAPSVSAQFKSQLDQLVVQISRTEAHYIRCLKPNEVKKPGVFDRERMVEQLRSVGVLEALRIARHGYSVRLAHATFVELFSGFRCLLSKRDRAAILSTQELARALVRALTDKVLEDDGIERERKNPGALAAVVSGEESEEGDAFEQDPRRQDVQVGKTLVFCKSTAYNRFSRYRLELRDTAAVTIQRRYRGFHRRVRFQQLRAFVLRVQTIARSFLARTQVEKLRQARRETSAVKLQRACRRWLAAKKRAAELEQARQLSAATRLQRQARLWLAQSYLVDAKVQRFRLATAFKRFRGACVAAQTEAETEPSPVPSDDSMAGRLKRRASGATAVVARRSSGLDGTQSSSEVGDESSFSDEKLEPLPVHVAPVARRRANSKPRSRAGSRPRGRTSSSHVDDRNSMLESEIVRLQQMLVESQNGRTPPSSSSSTRERRRASSVARPPRSAPLHLAPEPSVRPPRVYSSRRSYSMDGADFSEDEMGEEADELSLLPPRRARSVMPGQQVDHVSVLSQKIEELDAKCKFLEQLVARKNDEDAARESLMYSRDFDRGRFSSLDGSVYGSAYGDAPPSEADSDVDSIIFNIQSQMHMLRQSIAVKEQAIQTSRKSHAMSFSSSTRPTRTSSAASTTSYSNLPANGEAPPSLPSLTPSESQLSAGGSSFGNGPLSGGSSLGLPPTPTSVASASMASYYQGPPRSAPAHFGGRGMPRIVKWARATNCYECEEPFNLFVRRHHCRMCGNSFCHEHSSRRLSLFGIGFDDEPVRVCDNCFAEYYAASQDPFAHGQYPQQFGGFASGPLSSSSRLSAM